MKTKILSYLRAILCLLLGGAAPAFAQSTAFKYQGRLINGTSAANGSYDLQFILYVDAFSSLRAAEPVTNTAVGVTDGVFSTTIDFGPSAFTGPLRYLEIGVRTNGSVSAFTILAPTQQITPTPTAIYAYNAATAVTANSVAGNAVTGPAIQDGVITAAKLAPGQVVKSLNGLMDAVLLLAGTNITLTPSGDTIRISSSGGPSNSVAKTGDMMSGSLSIITPGILGFGAQTRQMIDLWNNNGADYGIGVQASTFYQRSGAPAGGFAWYKGGVHSDAQNDPGTNGTTLMALSSSGNLQVNASAGASAVSGNNPNATGVSGTSSIGEGVYGSGNNGIHGESLSIGGSGVWGNNTGGGAGVSGSSTTGRGVYGSSTLGDGVYGSSITGTGVHGEGTGGWGVFGRSQSNLGVFGQTLTNAQAGVLGRNDGPTGIGGQGVFGYASNGANGVKGISEGGDAVVGESHGKSGVVGFSSSATGYGGYFYNTGGGVALHVNGSAEVLCLTILGGCDVAEPFQMSSKVIPQGSVVVIDDANAGKLKLSYEAYDTRVAGIVSGANGVNPGVTLHQEGVMEGGQNVALSGRVYVLTDATNGAIKPGDLLTTSTTPGHAMRVGDRTKAQGAILGKAMSSLEEGKGMVLVLVTLQ